MAACENCMWYKFTHKVTGEQQVLQARTIGDALAGTGWAATEVTVAVTHEKPRRGYD